MPLRFELDADIRVTTPVPEPASLQLIALGGAALVAMRRRRRPPPARSSTA